MTLRSLETDLRPASFPGVNFMIFLVLYGYWMLRRYRRGSACDGCDQMQIVQIDRRDRTRRALFARRARGGQGRWSGAEAVA